MTKLLRGCLSTLLGFALRASSQSRGWDSSRLSEVQRWKINLGLPEAGGRP